MIRGIGSISAVPFHGILFRAVPATSCLPSEGHSRSFPRGDARVRRRRASFPKPVEVVSGQPAKLLHPPVRPADLQHLHLVFRPEAKRGARVAARAVAAATMDPRDPRGLVPFPRPER